MGGPGMSSGTHHRVCRSPLRGARSRRAVGTPDEAWQQPFDAYKHAFGRDVSRGGASDASLTSLGDIPAPALAAVVFTARR